MCERCSLKLDRVLDRLARIEASLSIANDALLPQDCGREVPHADTPHDYSKEDYDSMDVSRAALGIVTSPAMRNEVYY